MRSTVPRPIRLAAAIASVALIGATAAQAQAQAQDEAGGGTEDTPLSELEDRLLAAESLVLEFAVKAEGPLAADLTGSLETDADGYVELIALGKLGGREFGFSLKTEGDELVYENARGEQRGKTPPALKEAILIGFTRMGILHNVFRLASGSPPDHAGGGVREWVTAKNVEQGDDGAITFDIAVSDQPSGSATLTLHPESGLPASRTQTVRSPGGEVEVEETYSNVEVEAAGSE